MSTNIIATGISSDPTTHSAIEHAVEAAKACVSKAGIAMQDVDYLINTGVYRDHNIVEPSIASLVQKGMGLNLDYIKSPVERPTFSFDLMNGNSGVINAFHVADSLLSTGRARYVLITSSDAHPSRTGRDDFPFTPMGGAILLTHSEAPGFVGFRFESGKGEYTGSESYVDANVQGLEARFGIIIDVDDSFEERLLAHATETCRGFLEKQGISPDEVALVPSQVSSEFVAQLGNNLGIRKEARLQLFDTYGDAATSTFALALETLGEHLADQSCPYLLFVGASAGLHCGCALYQGLGPA